MTLGSLSTSGRHPPAASASLQEGEVGEERVSLADEIPGGAAAHHHRAFMTGSSSMSTRRSGSSESLQEARMNLSGRMLDGFDACIGVVILANAISIGVEQSLDLAGADISAFAVLEHVFLATYVLELIVRGMATGGQCFRDNWVRFDVFLVGAGVASFWIITPIIGDVQAIESVSMFRLLRLLRLARAVRLISVFRELWMLVQGLLVSARTMVYTIALIVIILYLFAVVAVEVITKHNLAKPGSGDPAFQSIVDNSFNTLPQTMMTLLQFVSFDNVVLIYEPLVKSDWRLALFFISIIVVVGILLMNLVTAVVVNSALEQALADKELAKKQEEDEKKKMCKELRKLFHRLDVDASGHVSMDEILQISDEDRRMLNSMLGVSDPLELFQALDVDGSGEVDIDEFCNGLWQVCVSKAPIEIKRVEKMVEAMRAQLRTSESVMATMVKEMGELKYNFNEKLKLLSSSASASSPGPSETGNLGGADSMLSDQRPAGSALRDSEGSSSAWDRAPLMKEVEADCDSCLASGIQALLKDPRPSGAAAVHGRLGAGAAARTARAAGLSSGLTADELSLDSDISTATAWIRELTFEVRSIRATLTPEVLVGSKAQAPRLKCGRYVTPDVLHEVMKASRSSSKASCSSSNLGDLSPTRRRTGAKACDGNPSPTRCTTDPAPRRAKPDGSAPPASEAATSSPRRPLEGSPARAPEASPGGASAPVASASRAATAARPRAAGGRAPRFPAGRVALARDLAAGPGEVHHL